MMCGSIKKQDCFRVWLLRSQLVHKWGYHFNCYSSFPIIDYGEVCPSSTRILLQQISMMSSLISWRQVVWPSPLCFITWNLWIILRSIKQIITSRKRSGVPNLMDTSARFERTWSCNCLSIRFQERKSRWWYIHGFSEKQEYTNKFFVCVCVCVWNREFKKICVSAIRMTSKDNPKKPYQIGFNDGQWEVHFQPAHLR